MEDWLRTFRHSEAPRPKKDRGRKSTQQGAASKGTGPAKNKATAARGSVGSRPAAAMMTLDRAHEENTICNADAQRGMLLAAPAKRVKSEGADARGQGTAAAGKVFSTQPARPHVIVHTDDDCIMMTAGGGGPEGKGPAKGKAPLRDMVDDDCIMLTSQSDVEAAGEGDKENAMICSPNVQRSAPLPPAAAPAKHAQSESADVKGKGKAASTQQMAKSRIVHTDLRMAKGHHSQRLGVAVVYPNPDARQLAAMSEQEFQQRYARANKYPLRMGYDFPDGV